MRKVMSRLLAWPANHMQKKKNRQSDAAEWSLEQARPGRIGRGILNVKIARFLSSSFLGLAVALVAYGLFGFSHFAWYTGEYYDARMVLFDHGFYPFAWGIAFLVIGQIMRLQHRRPAMLMAACTSLVLFLWKRVTVPGPIANEQLFPDSSLLNGLIITAIVVVVLALVDGHIEQVIRNVLRRKR